MADYYPVLKRAIASLPSSSGEARRIVYEKARAALLKQLQSYNPPLSPSDITDQRLALEECIRRVESEVAGAAFGLSAPGAEAAVLPPAAPPMPAAPPVQGSDAGAAMDARREPPMTAPPAAPPPASSMPPTPMPQAAMPQAPMKPAPMGAAPASALPGQVQPQPMSRANPQPVDTSRIGGDRPVPPAAAAPFRPAPRPSPQDPAPIPPVATIPKPQPMATPRAAAPEPAPVSPPEPRGEPTIGAGLSALSRTLRQAEALGGASAQAVRKARVAIDEEDPAPDAPTARVEPGKIEPGFIDTPLGTSLPEPLPEEDLPPAKSRKAKQAAAPGRRLSPAVIGLAILVIAVVGAGAAAYVQRDRIAALFQSSPTTAATVPDAPAATTPAEGGDNLEPKIVDRLPQEGGPPVPVAPDANPVQTETVAPSPDDADVLAGAPPIDPTIESAAPANVDPVTIDGAPPARDVTATETAPAETPAETPPGETEVAVVAPPTTPPGETPAAGVAVAQRAILYEEPVPGSEGARVEGQVLWEVVNEPVLPGEPAVPQLRATIEVPERSVKMVMSIRRNADPALPASHVAELAFTLPADFPGRSIDTTPGLILKQREDARGDPLIGAVAKVADNLFWLALSGNGQDSARNIQLLRERQWIDVPIRYSNRRRAILTFEKGGPGEAALASALTAWGN